MAPLQLGHSRNLWNEYMINEWRNAPPFWHTHKCTQRNKHVYIFDYSFLVAFPRICFQFTVADQSFHILISFIKRLSIVSSVAVDWHNIIIPFSSCNISTRIFYSQPGLHIFTICSNCSFAKYEIQSIVFVQIAYFSHWEYQRLEEV